MSGVECRERRLPRALSPPLLLLAVSMYSAELGSSRWSIVVREILEIGA